MPDLLESLKAEQARRSPSSESRYTALETMKATKEDLLEKLKAEQARRKQNEQMLNLDTRTGLPDAGLRIKISFASTPQNALKTLRESGYPEAQRLEDGRLVYLNESTNRWTTVDEENLTLHDLADLVGLTPELTFGTIGSIAGGGTPASIAGAAAGGAIGEQVKRAIGKLVFQNSELTGRQAAKDMLVAAGANATGETAALGLIKLTRPFANKVPLEAKKGMESFAKFRGKLSPAQATETRMLDWFENVAEYSLGGGEVFRQFRHTKQRIPLENWAKAIANDIAEKVPKEEAGNIVKLALNRKESIFKRTAGVLFDKVDAAAQGKMVSVKNVKNMASTILKQHERPLTPVLKSKVGGMQSDKILKELADLPDDISWKTAQDIRSDLFSLSKSSRERIPDRVIGSAKQMTHEMDSAMETSAQSYGGDLLDLFRRANDFWKKGKETFNSKLVRKLTEENPEFVGKAIFQPGASSQIRMIRKLVGKKTWNKLQRGYFEEVFQPDPVTGILRGDDVIKRLDNMGMETLNEIFPDKTHLKAFYEWADVARLATSTTKDAPGRMWIQLAQGGAAAAWLSGAFGAKPAVIVLGPAVLAKIFTNKAGIKLLTEGLTTPAGTKKAASLTSRFFAIYGKEEWKD